MISTIRQFWKFTLYFGTEVVERSEQSKTLRKTKPSIKFDKENQKVAKLALLQSDWLRNR